MNNHSDNNTWRHARGVSLAPRSKQTSTTSDVTQPCHSVLHSPFKLLIVLTPEHRDFSRKRGSCSHLMGFELGLVLITFNQLPRRLQSIKSIDETMMNCRSYLVLARLQLVVEVASECSGSDGGLDLAVFGDGWSGERLVDGLREYSLGAGARGVVAHLCSFLR